MMNWLETGNPWWDATAFSLADSFIQVGSWIVLGMVLVTLFDHLSEKRFSGWIEKSGFFQPMIATLLGAIPGCVTALLMIPMFEKKQIRSGTLLALLISTSGDAAFIILALSPVMWGWITLISIVVALITAYTVNYTPIGDYLDTRFRDKIFVNTKTKPEDEICNIQHKLKTKTHNLFDTTDTRVIGPLLMTLLVATIPLSILRLTPTAANDAVLVYDTLMSDIWVIAGLITIIWYPIRHFGIRFYENKKYAETNYCALCNVKGELDDHYQKVYSQVIFIMFWVILANFIYGMVEVGVGKDAMYDFFASGAGFTAIAIGLLVGAIPGCGPTIIFANLFTAGMLPISAMTTAAIGQDGDVAMPLLASSKKSFLVFKMLALIPALITGIIMLFAFGL